MNHTSSIFTVLSVLVSTLVFAIWSNTHVYAQQLSSSSPPAGSSSSLSTTKISPELKAKMCDPSNPSLRVVNTTESHICGIPKTVKLPTLSATLPSTSPAVSSSSITKPAIASLAAPKQQQHQQQQQITTINNNNNNAVSRSTRATTGAAITAPVSNPSSRTLSSSSTIAPQVNTINKLRQPQLQQQQIVKTSNSTAGQNYTFASTSPVVTSGKLMYLDYHGDTTHSSSTGKSSTTNLDTNHGATADSNSKHKVSSDTKHTTATSDSTHKHDNTKGKNPHESGDSL